jgi:SAM-dependent methyltransferase
MNEHMTTDGDAAIPAPVDWDAQAAVFDDEPDHGLRDPDVRAAWAERLRDWFPGRPSDVLDLGCGTGSLSLLAAEQGHRVTGVDQSPAMVGRARAKLAGRDAVFLVGDAAAPPVGEQRFDVVLVRHVLWALPDPAAALGRWVRLLRPGGRLLLVEGSWSTGAGLSAADCEALVRGHREVADVHRLDGDPAYWGGEVTDERYLLVSPA